MNKGVSNPIKMGKRLTITVDPDIWERFCAIKGKMIIDGRGDVSFTKYTNMCLGFLNPTIDQFILSIAVRKQKLKESL